ncbi:MAG TPA: GntR family transcriptional regulator [Streptosporangiaceae bacterium]|nr:GntR family transcriptional regulator [Streptosporangiaceae bacterium]
MADPMWRQIAEDLRQKIESGELGHGGKALPSELELRETYQASRNTVRDAVKWLVTRGLVVTRPGQGTFVVTKIDPFVTQLTDDGAGPGAESTAYASEVTAQSRTPETSVPRVEIQQAAGLVAVELRLPAGTTVVSRHQQRFIDDTPWSLQTTWYSMGLVTQGAARLIQAEEIHPGVVDYIEQVLGIKQAGWRDRFTVRAPDRRETEFFSLPDDGRIAVIEIVRTGYDQSGEPFRVTVTTYPADRNQFVMLAGEVPDESVVRAVGTGGAE